MRRRDEPYRWAELATYNAERARGLVHTPEWRAHMAREQTEFDAEQRAWADVEAARHSHLVVDLPGGGTITGPPDVVRRVAEAINRDEIRSEGP